MKRFGGLICRRLRGGVSCTIPVEVILDRSDGMPARCVVNLDDITTLPKVLIKQRITALSMEKIQQIDEAIRFALDLD